MKDMRAPWGTIFCVQTVMQEWGLNWVTSNIVRNNVQITCFQPKIEISLDIRLWFVALL